MEKNIDELMWNDWKIQSILGKGSYGTVYKVKKDGFDSDIYSAVKHLSIPFEKSEITTIRSEGMTKKEIKSYYGEIVNHISGEIRLMDSLKGTTNIVSIEDFKIIEKKEEIGWDVLIRMELLDDLNVYFENKSGSVEDIIKVGIDICNALECCSKANIIHRDIKPENIFVNKFGDFKLGDFGIAREYSQTRADMSMRGTPYYIAPEIYEGKEYDSTVDIYSLGIVLYRLLNNNRLPFFSLEGAVSFTERNEALRKRLSGESFDCPVNSIPELSEAVFKACSYNPEDRYQSPSEFKKALANALDIVLNSDNPPQYNFCISDDNDYNSIKGSTYDLTTGTVLLPENIEKKQTFSDKIRNYKKIIACSLSVLVLLIAIAAFAGTKANNRTEEYVVQSSNAVSGYSTMSSVETVKETVKKTTKKKEETATAKSVVSQYSKVYTSKSVYSKNKTTAKKHKATKDSVTDDGDFEVEETTKKKKKKTVKKTTAKKKTTKKKVSVGSVGGISVSKSGSNVRASWGSASNANEYYVTINGPGGFRSKNTVLTNAQFPLNGSGTYRISVTPIGSHGERGRTSSTSYKYNE